MTTIREYFDTDQKALNADTKWVFKKGDDVSFDVLCKLSYKIEEKTKQFSFYFPEESDFLTIKHIIDTEEVKSGKIDEYEDIQTISYLDNPEKTNLSECTYIKNIFIYINRIVKEEEKNTIIEYGKQMGYKIIIRDAYYAKECNALSKPLAFISHDSRDKDSLVRELSQKLISLNCPVWYDEYSLKIGDSLREKIDDGIKDAPYCILILSKNFISNEKWAKSEFETIFIKEIFEKKNIIIPVWHDIDEEDLYNFCPKLLNRLGANSSKGIDQLAQDLSVILKQ